MCPLILSTLIKDAFFSGRWPITKERYKKGGRGGVEGSKIITVERLRIKIQILQSSIPQLHIPTQIETNLPCIVE